MSELEPTRTYSNHTATEKLRRLLDERGVVWGASDTYRLLVTSWSDASGHSWSFMEHRDGSFSKLTAYHLAPEQAIAATLGATDARPTQAESSGTCKLDDFADVPFSVDYEIEGYDMGSFRDYATLAECSACGAYILVPPEYHHVLTCDGDEVYQPYRFCPCCGKKVVEPATNDVDAKATNG